MLSQDEWPQWLLSEIDPEDRDRAYGISALGADIPALRHVSLAALAGLSDLVGLDVRQETHFVVETMPGRTSPFDAAAGLAPDSGRKGPIGSRGGPRRCRSSISP
ncbi:MAG: DUF2958 domain-containing protein [Steroidobacteraceae bacterium]